VVAESGDSLLVLFGVGGVLSLVARELERDPTRHAAPAEGPAELCDESARKLGSGAPYYRYTVGQRRGLGLAAAEPLYVLGIDAARNRVTVGSRQRLLAPGFVGERAHWIGDPGGAHDRGVEATVRIRSRHGGVAARVRCSGTDAVVEFEEPQHGVAPGQAAVFYRGTRVLGGCWITRPLS
jgi:tRNA-specific 2-thiouridylase